MMVAMQMNANEQTNKRTNKRTNKQTNKWTNEQTNEIKERKEQKERLLPSCCESYNEDELADHAWAEARGVVEHSK